jgi:hypothetical protein
MLELQNRSNRSQALRQPPPKKVRILNIWPGLLYLSMENLRAGNSLLITSLEERRILVPQFFLPALIRLFWESGF